MKKAIIYTENGIPIFRFDTVENNQSTEETIAKFIIALETKKGMIATEKVVQKLEKFKPKISLFAVMKFFSEPKNIAAFIAEFKETTNEIRTNLKENKTQIEELEESKKNIRRLFNASE